MFHTTVNLNRVGLKFVTDMNSWVPKWKTAYSSSTLGWKILLTNPMEGDL